MRYIFHLIFLANMILCGMIPFLFPGRVALRFGAHGEAIHWGSPVSAMLILGGTVAFTYFLLLGCVWLIKICPVMFINIPINEKFWKSEENASKMRQITEKMLWELSAVTLLFLFAINSMFVYANLREPPREIEEVFTVIFGIFILSFLVWFVRCCLAYRIPKEPEGPI